MIGETLDDKYKIIRLLGQGGMGSVYEAEQTGTRRRVAVKVIGGSPAGAGDPEKRSPDLVNRFQREAKAASAIDTEHIARVLDAGTDSKTNAPYLVMEYLDGEDLQHLIDRTGPLPPRVALKIVAQACVGLDKAHAARVVHRDIKPANLFLARSAGGEVIVKLLDFGIAKIKGDPVRGLKTSDLTSSGSILGSPLFMSPEQVQDIKTLDYRTDLWSLGVVLYCGLAGRAPHEDIKNFAKLIMALCDGRPPPIQEVAPWVSPEVAEVVHGALQKDPASRFPSATAMLEAIKPLLPGGFELDEEMLVPLEAEARSMVSPRLDRTTAALDRDEVETTGSADLTEEIVVKQVVAVAERGPEIHGTETTEQVFVEKKVERKKASAAPLEESAPEAPPARARSRAGLKVGAVLLVGLGVFGASRALSPRSSMSSMEQRPPVVLPPADPPRPSEPPAIPSPQLLNVKLAVSPSDASVEIGGWPAKVHDGVVEIKGEVGSVHEVRIFKGRDERSYEVTVTEEGATPASLELKGSAPEPRGSAGKKIAPVAATATASAKATAEPAPPKPTTSTADPLLQNNEFK